MNFMKVLITGGYGFIGSHVAELFHKEGFEVHILDNLSSGKRENISFKHHSYILSIDDPKCKEIFSTYSFEIVIHLASSSESDETYAMQTIKTNLAGLVNLLQLSSEYKTTKFIYLSSAAVYGDTTTTHLHEQLMPKPISSYGINHWTGEQYCNMWQEIYQLNTLILRLAHVYGPRQSIHTNENSIPIICSKILNYEPIQGNHFNYSLQDFIYVKDVAFAIYRASQSILTGTYNLSSNTLSTTDDIIQILKQSLPYTISYEEVSIRRPIAKSLNNTSIKTQLDWIPFYTLEEGLSKTAHWITEQESITRKQSLKKKQSFQMTSLLNKTPLLRPYLENTLLFLFVSIIFSTIPFFNVSPFLFGVFYIVFIGSIYGNPQSFLATIYAFLFLVISNLSIGRELISLLYDAIFLFQISMFLFFGLVIGYSTQRRNVKILEQQEVLDDFSKRYQFLEEVHSEVRQIKDELQQRLKNNEDSFGKIYSIIKELDDLEPEKIFTNTVKVVERLMGSNDVCIYLFNPYQTFLRLVAHSELQESRIHANSLRAEDTPFVKYIMETGGLYVNRTLQPGAPLLACPIYFNEELKAILMINQLPFEKLSTYHENLFIVIKQLIQTSLSRAFDYIKLTENQRYIDGTSILKEAKFDEIIQAKEQAKKLHQMPYVLLRVPVSQKLLKETAEAVHRLLRETDYLGYKNEQLHLLLSNTKESDLQAILKRFNQAGITVELPQRATV